MLPLTQPSADMNVFLALKGPDTPVNEIYAAPNRNSTYRPMVFLDTTGETAVSSEPITLDTTGRYYITFVAGEKRRDFYRGVFQGDISLKVTKR